MSRSFAGLALLLAVLLAPAGLAVAQTSSPQPPRSIGPLVIEMDKTGATGRSAPLAEEADFAGLLKQSVVNLDLRIKLDETSSFRVLTSAEDIGRRFNVECRPGVNGRLPMGPGVEYYIKSESAQSPKIELSIYPGSRSEHVLNDIDCAYDDASKAAVFRARGLYVVLSSEYPDVIVVQLRPLVPGFAKAAGSLRDFTGNEIILGTDFSIPDPRPSCCRRRETCSPSLLRLC